MTLFAVLLLASFQMDGSRLVVADKIEFETGKAAVRLSPASGAALDHVAAFLREKESITKLRIEVHSDAQGSEAANQKMSELRAHAVARALVGRGIDCERLLPVGFGETKPVADNRTAEGRLANRRVEFVMAEMRGRLVGGMPADGGGVASPVTACEEPPAPTPTPDDEPALDDFVDPRY
jgi:OOP family OmpA-OmpF porin